MDSFPSAWSRWYAKNASAATYYWVLPVITAHDVLGECCSTPVAVEAEWGDCAEPVHDTAEGSINVKQQPLHRSGRQSYRDRYHAAHCLLIGVLPSGITKEATPSAAPIPRPKVRARVAARRFHRRPRQE